MPRGTFFEVLFAFDLHCPLDLTMSFGGASMGFELILACQRILWIIPFHWNTVLHRDEVPLLHGLVFRSARVLLFFPFFALAFETIDFACARPVRSTSRYRRCPM